MINLLPDEIRESIRFGGSIKKVVNITAIVLSVIGISIAIEMAGLTLLSKAQDEINDSITQKEATIAEFNDNQSEAIQLSQDIDTVKALVDRQANFSELVKAIGRALPTSATLSRLTLGETIFEQTQLELTVDTQERAAIARQNIEDSPIFAGADILNIRNGEVDEETEEVLNQNVTINTRLCQNFKEIIAAIDADPNAEVDCL